MGDRPVDWMSDLCVEPSLLCHYRALISPATLSFLTMNHILLSYTFPYIAELLCVCNSTPLPPWPDKRDHILVDLWYELCYDIEINIHPAKSMF